MTEEYQRLLHEAKEQCEQHKAVLKTQVPDTLKAQVDQIRVEVVQREPGITEGALPTLSVVWDYPDQLYAWLDKPENKELSLIGGILLSDHNVNMKGTYKR